MESNQGLDKNFSEGLAVHSLIQIYFHQGQCGFESDHTTPRWLSKMQPRVSLEQNPAPENVALHQKGVLPSAPVLVGRSPLSALHPAQPSSNCNRCHILLPAIAKWKVMPKTQLQSLNENIQSKESI